MNASLRQLLDSTSPIFHSGNLVIYWMRLGYLLDEAWLEEDVLNVLAELCYYRITVEKDCMDFVYLPTLAFNDARQLYNSKLRVYSSNLTAFCQLLDAELINTIAFGVWHNNHYHGFRYTSASGMLLHGNSQHGTAPDDVLPIINWLLEGTQYLHPTISVMGTFSYKVSMAVPVAVR